MKKTLIIGGIIILMVLSSIPIVNASEGKPDLIIEDLLISPGSNPREEDFSCLVKNVGNASTPSNKALDITVTMRWKPLGLLPLILIRKFTAGIMGSLAPGENIDISFATTNRMPYFGFYSFYCRVNPEYIIDESTIRNNVYSETVLFLFHASFFSYKNLFFNPGSNQYEYMKLK